MMDESREVFVGDEWVGGVTIDDAIANARAVDYREYVPWESERRAVRVFTADPRPEGIRPDERLWRVRTVKIIELVELPKPLATGSPVK